MTNQLVEIGLDFDRAHIWVVLAGLTRDGLCPQVNA